MRITHLELKFLDGTQSVENYTTPGWYIMAADTDAEGHLWAIRPIKLTPQQATEISLQIGQIVGSGQPVAGIRNQNAYATDQVRRAVARAEALVREATQQARALEEWESAK